jgi:lipoprotein-anchoring transpeptidase ErfK/SrfK
MPDYYAILWRALRKGDFQSARWRQSVFEQTRGMLRDQLRNTRPPMSNTDIRLHTDALEAAIQAIQNELAQEVPAGAEATLRGSSRARPTETYETGEAPPKVAGHGSLPTLISIATAIVVAAALAGGYAFLASRPGTPPQQQSKIESPSAPPPPAMRKVEVTQQPAAPSLKRPKLQHKTAALSDGDLPPGVDGGSTDADVPFFFRRQPVFYRTSHSVGSIIIDKQQHFLYLIQPNQVAMRYGIGVGKSCAGVAGLHKVAGKKEWPEWQPPADMVERKLAPAGAMKGGPGNPLGARIIILDDGGMSIHGTNAPKSIGSHVDSGCIRLVNDDVADLYNRVAVGAHVIFSD